MPQDRYWKAVVREDLISSETFCTHSEASISHLDVEGHESLACALPMVAHTKQVPDSKPRASQKISVPIRAVSSSHCQKLSPLEKKNQVALIPRVELIPE